MSETDSWKQELEKLRNDLQGMADEIRVKVHLAGMEAKDTWHKLEPRLHELEAHAERTATATADEVRDLAKDLKTRLKKLRDTL